MGMTNAEKQARFRAKRDAEIERLRKAAAAPSSPDSPDHLIEARAEIERLRNQNAALLAAPPPLSKVERSYEDTITRLERALKASRTRVQNLTELLSLWESRSQPPRMSKRLHRQVLGLLHPDRAHDDEAMRKKLERTFQEFSAIKFNLDSEAT